MTAKVSIFNSDVRLIGLEATKQAGYPEFRYFGILEQSNPLTVAGLHDEYRSWVCVACRSGSVTVTISATAQPSNTYTVEPGLPLFYLPPESHAVQEVEVSSVEETAEVEVYVFTSGHLISPPSPAFLVLNAGTGVTLDEFDAEYVDTWRDTRVNSLAPLDFIWSDAGETRPVLIESDPDFGGRPSVSFEDSGESRFIYSAVDPALWNFMVGHNGAGEGGTDFTVMAIMSARDNAQLADKNQGIWGTPANGTMNGITALIDGGYRTYVAVPLTGSFVLSEDELIEKPFVIIWQYTVVSQTMRVYWQGRWHEEHSLTASTTSPITDLYRLNVGGAIGDVNGSPARCYLRGKIADFRVYNRHLTAAEKAAYIAMAANDYGVDDTEEQGFPWVAQCINMHRANRGLLWSDEEETELTTWSDTRMSATTGSLNFAPGDFDSPTAENDEYLNDQPALQFDGEEQALVNPFSSSAADHLDGRGVGMTVTFVSYYSDDPSSSPLMSMGVYSTNDDGTSIAYYGFAVPKLYYETTESEAGLALAEQGPMALNAYSPMALVYRLDGSGKWWIDEMKLETGETESLTGDYAEDTGTSNGTSSPVYMAAFESAGSKFPGAIAEMTTAATKVSNAQVQEFFAYARRRYAGA